MKENGIILGDFNAHSKQWHTADTEGNRGKQLNNWIGDTNLIILNDDIQQDSPQAAALHQTSH